MRDKINTNPQKKASAIKRKSKKDPDDPQKPPAYLDDKIDKRVSTALCMRLETAKQAGKLAYCPNIFVSCTLPHSNPKTPDGKLLQSYHRKDGRINFVIQSAPAEFRFGGIPYGIIPRRLLIYLATYAKIHKTREILLGDSMSEFMRQINLSVNGGVRGDIKRLHEQAMKLFSSRIFSWTEEPTRFGINWEDFPIAERGSMWWDPVYPDKKSEWTSKIYLSERAFQELTINSVPVDLRPIENDGSIGSSALGLDLYAWLPYRCFKASISGKESRIPWRLLMFQFGAGYPDTPRGQANFRSMVRPLIKLVCGYYPELRVDCSSPDYLLVSPNCT